MRRMMLLMAASAIGLAGCAQGPSGPGGGTGVAAGAAPEGFQCPPAGTVIGFPDGRRLQFAGADPADPFVCLATDTGSGRSQRRLGNWYPLPMHDEANVRRSFAALWPLAPGQATSFLYDDATPNGSLVALNSRWRVLEPRVMQIAGSDRQVLVIENVIGTARRGFQQTWTYFYDTAARSVVGGDITVQQGISHNTNWRAESITVPR